MVSVSAGSVSCCSTCLAVTMPCQLNPEPPRYLKQFYLPVEWKDQCLGRLKGTVRRQQQWDHGLVSECLSNKQFKPKWLGSYVTASMSSRGKKTRLCPDKAVQGYTSTWLKQDVTVSPIMDCFNLCETMFFVKGLPALRGNTTVLAVVNVFPGRHIS